MQGYRWNLGLYRIVVEDRWYARFFDNDKNEYSEWLVAIPAELVVPVNDKTMNKDLEKLAERNRTTLLTLLWLPKAYSLLVGLLNNFAHEWTL